VFYYKSTSGDALVSTNTALGEVIMATNYNVSQPSFVTKLNMETAEYVTTNKPSIDCLHPIECAPKESVLERKFIRNAALNSTQDPKFYDHGNFQLATYGSQAASAAGELWCSYKVKLFKPLLMSGNVQGLHVQIQPTTTTAFAASVIQPGSNLGYSTVSNTITLTGLNAGTNYHITYSANSAATYTQAATWAIISGATGLQMLNGDSLTQLPVGNTTAYYNQIAIRADNSTVVLTLGPPTSVGFGATGDIFVTAMPAALVSEEQKLSANELKLIRRLEALELKVNTDDIVYRHQSDDDTDYKENSSLTASTSDLVAALASKMQIMASPHRK
jgi:hypothetical protein